MQVVTAKFLGGMDRVLARVAVNIWMWETGQMWLFPRPEDKDFIQLK
jgi:hypothetical protein